MIPDGLIVGSGVPLGFGYFSNLVNTFLVLACVHCPPAVSFQFLMSLLLVVPYLHPIMSLS